MFSYLLNPQKWQNPPLINKTSFPHPTFICDFYGAYSKTNPSIRLRVPLNNHTVRIFEFPPQKDFPTSIWYSVTLFPQESYIRYPLCGSDASVAYVMGDDWRSQLRNDSHNKQGSLVGDGDVILQPSASTGGYGLGGRSGREGACVEDVEVWCGGDLYGERYMFYDAETNTPVPFYLFGWLQGGGAWFLLYPSTDEEVVENLMRLREELDAYYALAMKASRLDIMEDVCWLLEESGVQFYGTIAECPEAVEIKIVWDGMRI
jgi:hypothetical protein